MTKRMNVAVILGLVLMSSSLGCCNNKWDINIKSADLGGRHVDVEVVALAGDNWEMGKKWVEKPGEYWSDAHPTDKLYVKKFDFTQNGQLVQISKTDEIWDKGDWALPSRHLLIVRDRNDKILDIPLSCSNYGKINPIEIEISGANDVKQMSGK